jgi:amidophosphoribosyltransferase
MDSKQWAETAGFAALAAGPGCSTTLIGALEGLGHRYVDRASLAVVAGRELVVHRHQGPLHTAAAELERHPLHGSRALLAVGGGGAPARPQDLIAGGMVAEQAVAVCMTGCVHNADALRQAAVERGALVTQSSHAELLLLLMAQSRQRTVVNRLLEALERMVGGFSLAVATDELLVVARDPRGFRPLWIAKRGEAHAAATDPAALNALGATGLCELSPGEVTLLEPGAPVRALRPWGVFPRAACVQEWLGFARVSASFEGLSVHALRQRMGRALAAACPAPADLVAGLPDDCQVAAMAYAMRAGLPLDQVFEPGLASGLGARASVPLRAVSAAVRGRRPVLVFQPSTPADRLHEAVASLRAAGARQVHLRCFAPLQATDCLYGQRLPPPALAAGSGLDSSALQAWLRADSLESIELDGLATALGRESMGCCARCLGGPAPLVARDAAATPQLPLFHGGSPGADDAMLV